MVWFSVVRRIPNVVIVEVGWVGRWDGQIQNFNPRLIYIINQVNLYVNPKANEECYKRGNLPVAIEVDSYV